MVNGKEVLVEGVVEKDTEPGKVQGDEKMAPNWRHLRDQERVQRETECAEAVQLLLNRYGCVLDPVFVFQNGKLTGRVNVTAKE